MIADRTDGGTTATAEEPPALSIAIGAYPHTEALRSGAIASDRVRLEFADIKPVNRAFAPMVRDGRFDISEMAIATFLQAKAFGKPLVLLPVVLAARFQEGAFLCRRGAGITGPAGLVGRRVGVRAYSQTTGMWLRGILQDRYGIRAGEMTWITFERAHVAEYVDPAWARRAEPGQDMMAMLKTGELDAVIVGNDVPDEPWLATVFPDPEEAARSFRDEYGFVPANHFLTVRRDVAQRHPDLLDEVVRMVAASAERAPPASGPVVTDPAALEPSLALAARFCAEQDLVPRALSASDIWEGSPAVSGRSA